MSDPGPTQPAAKPRKAAWKAPVIQVLGGLDRVEGGGNPGLDTNNLPAHS